MDIEIPRFLAHRPVYQGLPVPFTVMIVGGIPDFRVIGRDEVRRCIFDRLCAICGRKLGEYIWFIGGEESLERSCLFVDPPQHEACARFAIRACPFLSGRTTAHNDSRPVPFAVGTDYLVTPLRSKKVGMRRCKSFELVNIEDNGYMAVTRWWGKPIWLA